MSVLRTFAVALALLTTAAACSRPGPPNCEHSSPVVVHQVMKSLFTTIAHQAQLPDTLQFRLGTRSFNVTAGGVHRRGTITFSLTKNEHGVFSLRSASPQDDSIHLEFWLGNIRPVRHDADLGLWRCDADAHGIYADSHSRPDTSVAQVHYTSQIVDGGKSYMLSGDLTEQGHTVLRFSTN